MKKVVSMFVALAMAFTLGPVVSVRAENACEGENCQINDGSERLWAWCKENPKDCAAYVGETLWDLTKISCGKAKDAIVGVAQAIRDHNYTQTWENIKNYNYMQGFETAKENVKWVASEVSDKWSNTVSPWIGEKVDDAAKFEKQVEEFYNYDLNEQPKWTFWTLLTTAGVGVLTMGTWAFNLITCCGCGRCRLRMP